MNRLQRIIIFSAKPSSHFNFIFLSRSVLLSVHYFFTFYPFCFYTHIEFQEKQWAMMLQAIFIHSYFTPRETQNEIRTLYMRTSKYSSNHYHPVILWAYYIEAKLQHYMIMMDIVSRKGVEKAKLTMRYTHIIIYVRVDFSFLRGRLFVVSYWYLAYAP